MSREPLWQGKPLGRGECERSEFPLSILGCPHTLRVMPAGATRRPAGILPGLTIKQNNTDNVTQSQKLSFQSVSFERQFETGAIDKKDSPQIACRLSFINNINRK